MKERSRKVLSMLLVFTFVLATVFAEGAPKVFAAQTFVNNITKNVTGNGADDFSQSWTGSIIELKVTVDQTYASGVVWASSNELAATVEALDDEDVNDSSTGTTTKFAKVKVLSKPNSGNTCDITATANGETKKVTLTILTSSTSFGDFGFMIAYPKVDEKGNVVFEKDENGKDTEWIDNNGYAPTTAPMINGNNLYIDAYTNVIMTGSITAGTDDSAVVVSESGTEDFRTEGGVSGNNFSILFQGEKPTKDKKPSTITITSKSGQVSRTFNVYVLSAAMDIGIRFADDADNIDECVNGASVIQNKKAAMAVTLVGRKVNNKYIESTDTITWSIDKTDLATVSVDGEISGKAPGTCYLTATCDETANRTTKLSKTIPLIVQKYVGIESLGIKRKNTADTEVLTDDVMYVGDPVVSYAAVVNPINNTDSLTWNSTSSDVASINKDTGDITPIKEGQTTISVRTETGKTAIVQLTVKNPITQIAIRDVNDNTITSKTVVGSSDSSIRTIDLKAIRNEGSDTSEEIIWSTDNELFATVGSTTDTANRNNKKFTGNECTVTFKNVSEQKTVTITATSKAKGITASCVFLVNPSVNSGNVSIQKVTSSGNEDIVDDVELVVGKQLVLYAKQLDENGQIANDELSWTVSDQSIASAVQGANNTITLTGLKTGKITVTVTSVQTNKSFKCDIDVIIPSTAIKLTNSIMSNNVIKMWPDTIQSQKLIATLTPSNSSDTVTWLSSDTTKVTVTDEGVIKALKPTTTPVTITAKTSSGKIAVCSIIVVVPMTDLALDCSMDKTNYITLNESINVNATVTPATTTEELVWNSSSSNAKLTPSADTYSCKLTGNAMTSSDITITAKSAVTGIVIKSFKVYVAKRASSLTATVNATESEVNKTLTATANLFPTDSNDRMTWTASNPELVTLTPSTNTKTVTIKTLLPGKTTITAKTSLGYTATTEEITITAPTTSVKFAKTTQSVNKGKTLQLEAVVTPLYHTDELTWTSDDDSIATVDNNGLVTAKEYGIATITITSPGGKYATVKVTVNNRISALTVANVSDQIYTGSGITPAISINDGAKTLVSGTDYSLTYKNNILVGEAIITVTGKGDYAGSTLDVNFNIVKRNIVADNTVIGNISNLVYNGTEWKPTPSVNVNNKALTKDKDYTLTYSNNIVAGVNTAKVIITGTINYEGTIEKTFTITPKPITSGVTITVNPNSYVFDGKEKQPLVEASLADGTKLTPGTDYTVAYSSNVQVGTSAIVTVKGIGNYNSEKVVKFSITTRDMTNVTVVPQYTSVMYDGTDKKPTVTAYEMIGDVKYILAETDYNIVYAANRAIGQATITLNGKGNYSGAAKTNFTITPIQLSSSAVKTKLSATSYTYNGAYAKPVVTLTYGTKTLRLGTDYTVSYSNNKNIGTASVIVSGTGTYGGTRKISFNIYPKKTSSVSVSATSTTALKVKWSKDSTVTGYEVWMATSYNGKYTKKATITKNTTTYYSVTKLKTATPYYFKVRSYKVVSGKTYYGSYATYKQGVTKFNTIKISSISSRSKKITIKWNKVTNASGYQIIYATNSKFTAGKKTLTVSGGSITSKASATLTKGRTYYVKIRAYKTVRGTKVYGSYSSYKTIKVK